MSWKLSADDRHEIARLYAGGMTTTQLGQQFGVRQAHISRVLKDEGVTARPFRRPARSTSPRACERCGSALLRRPGENAHSFERRRSCSKACRYALAAEATKARRGVDPLMVGRRTLIAKTCLACGELLPAARFQRQVRGYYATTCGRCVQSGWIAGLPTDEREALLRHRQAEVARQNAEMRPGARRHRQLWTGPELELVERRELTAVQVAAMIGRTPHAVRTQRKLLNRSDPAKTFLAGVAPVRDSAERSDPSKSS